MCLSPLCTLRGCNYVNGAPWSSLDTRHTFYPRCLESVCLGRTLDQWTRTSGCSSPQGNGLKGPILHTSSPIWRRLRPSRLVFFCRSKSTVLHGGLTVGSWEEHWVHGHRISQTKELTYNQWRQDPLPQHYLGTSGVANVQLASWCISWNTRLVCGVDTTPYVNPKPEYFMMGLFVNCSMFTGCCAE